MSNENVNAQNNERMAAWYLQEAAWQQHVPRPPPIEIPAPPELGDGRAMGGAPVTPPSYQPPVNPPPAPRTDRRRPILNPEDESDDEEGPLVAENNAQTARQRVLALTQAALNMPPNAVDRWKLLQNSITALNTVGDPGGLAEYVQSVLRDQHGL
jgi:hypothetical protein